MNDSIKENLKAEIAAELAKLRALRPNCFRPVSGLVLNNDFDIDHLRSLLQNKKDLIKHFTEEDQKIKSGKFFNFKIF